MLLYVHRCIIRYKSDRMYIHTYHMDLIKMRSEKRMSRIRKAIAIIYFSSCLIVSVISAVLF